jgi:DNA polymerase
MLLVKPDGILCVGKVAARFLLGREDALHAMRGTIHRFEGIPVVITYHPAAVLRNLQLRGPVWEDLKRMASVLELPLPQGRR